MGFGRIPHQSLNVSGSKELGVYFDPVSVIKANVPKSDFTKLAHGMTFSGRDYIVVGPGLLEHHPHGLDILAGMAPISLCVKVTQAEFLGRSEFDFGHLRSNFPSNELDAPTTRLVIKEDSTAGKHIVSLAVILPKQETGYLGDCVSRTWMERSKLVLGTGMRFAKHLTRSSKVELASRRYLLQCR